MKVFTILNLLCISFIHGRDRPWLIMEDDDEPPTLAPIPTPYTNDGIYARTPSSNALEKQSWRKQWLKLDSVEDVTEEPEYYHPEEPGINVPPHTVPDDFKPPKEKKATPSPSLGSFSVAPAPASLLDGYKTITKRPLVNPDDPSAYDGAYNDPYWPFQWYAQDYRTKNMPVMDLNLVPVYRMDITGKNVKVAVVDSGVDHNHPDLRGNYLLELARDPCSGWFKAPGALPQPGDSRGTKNAGVIAMAANNNECGVGVAFNAKVAGIKNQCQLSSDSAYEESQNLIHKLDEFDIYTNSWSRPQWENIDGHRDKALRKGVNRGRKGKGAIYVFPAGDEGMDKENCAVRGYQNHEATIVIASASMRGKVTPYSEACAAILATTYAGKSDGVSKGVVTTTLNNKCTSSYTGTTAAVPLASGIIALLLDANSELTYRDVMHIVTMGAEVAPLADNGVYTWYMNGKGFWVSDYFGFGLMNALNMVNLAKTWKNVPPKNTCVFKMKFRKELVFNVQDVTEVMFDTLACQDTEVSAVNFLEQVEVSYNIHYSYRGALKINLISPAGTDTNLMWPRPHDTSSSGRWSVRSLHTWGENPSGTWTLKIIATMPPPVLKEAFGSKIRIDELVVTFHGTAEKPAHHDQLPRTYSAFRLPTGQTNINPALPPTLTPEQERDEEDNKGVLKLYPQNLRYRLLDQMEAHRN